MESKISMNEVCRQKTSMELAPIRYTCRSSRSSPAEIIQQEAFVAANKGLKRRGAERPITEESESVIRTTTKHPRHRPGCGCVVCNQRPSKKGKHLSRGRKRRRSGPKLAEDSQGYAAPKATSMPMGSVAGDMLAEALAGISMDSLIHAASLPLELYLRENNTTSSTQ